MTSRNRPVSPSLRNVAALVTLALAICAGSGLAVAGSKARGAVATSGPATKAVAAGPIALHAYSQFAGGSLYAVRAVTGTDADCTSTGGATPVVLPADRVVNFTVAEGEVACLATTTKGSFELLWHGAPAPAAAVMIAKARK